MSFLNEYSASLVDVGSTTRTVVSTAIRRRGSDLRGTKADTRLKGLEKVPHWEDMIVMLRALSTGMLVEVVDFQTGSSEWF